MSFREIDAKSVKENFIKLIADDWALVTAGDEAAHNTMTVSWGGVGELWRKDVTFIFIRPQRHTLQFVENNEYYSVCFFDDEYKDALRFCGTKSGRDYDKDKETGLTAVFDEKAPYYQQSKLVLICRKMAVQDIDPKCFIDETIDDNYAQKDYHKMFVGAIEKVLVKD